MQLLECVSYFDTKVPSAYCIYTPLAIRNLEDTICGYMVDPAAQITLSGDFLNGLSYLHEQKHVMHLDIKPGNLGVLSFSKPKGVILDFDSATSELASVDHHKGTIAYLAPEIIALKRWDEGQVAQKPGPFDKRVDIWALGLSMYALHTGQPWRWNTFARSSDIPLNGATINRANETLHSLFQATVIRSRSSTTDGSSQTMLSLIQKMTGFTAKERTSASELLQIASVAKQQGGSGTISLKTAKKRAREE